MTKLRSRHHFNSSKGAVHDHCVADQAKWPASARLSPLRLPDN